MVQEFAENARGEKVEPSPNKVPKHIGFIMDGNRRWAKKRNKFAWQGHEAGVKTFKKVVDWCKDIGVKELTMYTFSVQNFNRSPEEFKHMMRIMHKAADDLMNDKEFVDNKHGGKIKFTGRIEMFPEDLVKKLKIIMEKTKDNKKYVLNMAMAYGGREEITDAVKKIAKKVKAGKLDPEKINQNTIQKELYISTEPEFIVRTGGVMRTSNFLPWQSSYSEWFFLGKMWPDLEKEDILKCINEFNNRERRFGK